MGKHLKANAILLALTLLIGAVGYPLVVLAIGQGLFPSTANGSLVKDAEGKVVGSRLIAQEFKGDEWFQPRPSAVGYTANASGGSNLGANNPKLRDRVAGSLASGVRYKTRTGSVQKDIDTWYAARPDRLATWVKDYPANSANWLADSANAKAVAAWTETHPGDFYESFAASHPGAFPTVDKDVIVPATDGSSIQGLLFDSWLKDNPANAADVELAPADSVTTSGSGLDPHVTLENALGQVDRVASARATKLGKDVGGVRETLKTLVGEMAFAPLGGLVGGGKIVGVLELNLEVAKRLK